MRRPAACLTLAALLSGSAPAFAQVDARMFRYPDVSADRIAFVYAGDIWVAPKSGGLAHRLSSPRGEEMFPRFSPDGARIAFSANYDGNTDVYVVPALGGEPKRVTHHPGLDRLIDWTPDGGSLLFASSMTSGRQAYDQFWTVPAAGGLPTRLPVPYGEFAALSPDGRKIAYTTRTQDWDTWKRYRGGWAPDIWLFDLASHAWENLTPDPADDTQPMWSGHTLYFLSARDEHQRKNLWALDLETRALRELTHFTDFDLSFPAIGPSDIVFQAGGRLYLLDLATERMREVKISVVTDETTLRPRVIHVGDAARNPTISPSGARAVLEARGELFSVPAEHGPVRDLTRSAGVAERYPTWSPDGKQIACWSDRSGEYELTLRAADGTGSERQVTHLGPGFRYRPSWSPDSKRIAYVDQAMRLNLVDLANGRVTPLDTLLYAFHGRLEGFSVSWSPNGRWLAYAGDLPQRQTRIVLVDLKSGARRPMTSGYYIDRAPVFDPEGRYLFYISGRSLTPVYGTLDNSWIYPNTQNLVAVPLRREVRSPLGPRDDEEGAAEDTTHAKMPDPGVDLEGFESRGVVLPPRPGNLEDLQAVAGKLLFRRLPNTGSADSTNAVIAYDLKERKEEAVLDDADGFVVSADGKKLLAWKKDKFAIVAVAPKQSFEKPLRVGELEMTVEPRAEWRQLFMDAWRFERDLFYDRALHGVDWNAERARYARLLDDCVTRWDVNFVIGELIAELSSSHTYRWGGDEEQPATRGVGMLGADWKLENGAYRIARIVDGAPWDGEVRSPLRRPGANVREGDYVLAVNGVALDATRDPWAAFEGLDGKTVELSVNDRPTLAGARRVLVETLGDEARLRHLEWIEANRRRVEEASGGRIGYVYVPNTGRDGQTELVRQFRPQFAKPGLIVDERFNEGGQIPDRFLELLDRPTLAGFAVRDGLDWRWPPVSHAGPEVMLINGWSGSGGDCFPFFFREAGRGPLIGQRTWGGVIGLTGAPSLIDGGTVTVPTFRMYAPTGEWFAEGHGVDPDIPVVDDPTELARGRDPQLERAILEVERLLAAKPAAPPPHAPFEDRTARPR